MEVIFCELPKRPWPLIKDRRTEISLLGAVDYSRRKQ